MESNTSLRNLMFNDKIDTPNLSDFLRVKQDHNNNLTGLTLGAVLSNVRESSSSSSSLVHNSSRTLFDIIRDDPSNNSRKPRKWEHFRNKLRLKPNISIQHHSNPITPVENFTSASGSTSRILETAEIDGDEIGVELEDQPARMSLMALLTENDGDESAYMIEDGDADEEEDELDVAGIETGTIAVADVVDVGAGGEYNNCCVCMVRHKGAAFIPCGHTFCRLCSRELWVQRGNCPLCNNFILEVLDIF